MLVNAGLIALDLATGGGIQWAIWPLAGWGIGLAIHTAIFWLEAGPLGRDWEERKIEEIMERDDRRRDKQPPAQSGQHQQQPR